MRAAPVLNEAAARAWCVMIARVLTVRHIAPEGRPYLDRYFASGWNPSAGRRRGPAIFLHHFLASDPSHEVHSHPWAWSASLILAGGYREHRCTPGGGVTVREFHPGEVNVITADDRHRIDLLGADCWTVFLAGDFERAWEFAPLCT